MTYGLQNTFSPYANTNIYIPDDEESKAVYLTNLLKEIIERLNSKDTGSYNDSELLTGQSWFNQLSYSNRRAAFRTVIFFPLLTAIGITSVAHNLGDISGFTFTKIIGTAKDAAGTLHVPLPQAAPDDVMVTIDANNVNIICTTPSYDTFSAQVILEYLKN